jgi:hypothetical protein
MSSSEIGGTLPSLPLTQWWRAQVQLEVTFFAVIITWNHKITFNPLNAELNPSVICWHY